MQVNAARETGYKLFTNHKPSANANFECVCSLNAHYKSACKFSTRVLRLFRKKNRGNLPLQNK